MLGHSTEIIYVMQEYFQFGYGGHMNQKIPKLLVHNWNKKRYQFSKEEAKTELRHEICIIQHAEQLRKIGSLLAPICTLYLFNILVFIKQNVFLMPNFDTGAPYSKQTSEVGNFESKQRTQKIFSIDNCHSYISLIF